MVIMETVFVMTDIQGILHLIILLEYINNCQETTCLANQHVVDFTCTDLSD